MGDEPAQKVDAVNPIISLFLALAALTPIIIFWGWTISVLWNWVAPSLLLPSITVVQAIMLKVVLSAALPPASAKKTDWGQMFTAPLLFLAIGYVAKGFLP